MQRRAFLKNLAVVGGGGWLVGKPAVLTRAEASPLSHFKLGVISDELSQDFEEALRIMKGYGLRRVEVRMVWGVYNTEASPEQMRRLRNLLNQYEFKVSVLDTALYKCDLPGTKGIAGDKALYPYPKQMDMLKRAIERAHVLGTDTLRVFSFWRVARPEEHFPRIAEELSKAVEVSRRSGMRLVLENESACNVSNGHELARMLELVPAKNLGANWDVGNGYWTGEVSFPTGYAALPKQRLWHMHLKDVLCDPGHRHCRTVIVGHGQVDLVGQFRALVRDGYQGTVSLEPEYEDSSTSHLEATRRSLEALLNIMNRTLK